MSEDASWISPEERISRRVFIGTLALVMLALRWPELPAEWLNGILWTGLGLMILLAPPTTRLPLAWPLLALGFVLCSSLGFLPRAWFTIPSWRTDLEALGLDTGPHAFVQARLAAETLIGQAITATAVIYLLGHRVGPRMHLTLAVAFAFGVAIMAAWAMAIHDKGETFGFFPNRNHTACILAVGGIMGFGAFIQAVRQKAPVLIALSMLATAAILIALLAYSESRAGIVLLGIGLAIVLPVMGRRYVRGHAGIAMILVIGTVTAAFFIVDSKAKSRLVHTVEKLENRDDPVQDPVAEKSPFATTTQALDAPPLDGRVSIFQDTSTMIRTEPWTGVGPWQFRYVFPQYRLKSVEPNDSTAFHPESNWLWLAAESGIAAAFCLLIALVLASTRALKDALHGHSRAVRVAGIIAALLVPIHGLVDVPGHRIGIAWTAALLLALSLRPPSGEVSEATAGARNTAIWTWRLLGLAVLGSGILLGQAGINGKPILTLEKARDLNLKAERMYMEDQAAYEKAAATGTKYDPAAADDPLEMALDHASQASMALPLDPYFYHLNGNLALHYDDKSRIVERAFAIESRLAPTVVGVTLRQAAAFSASHVLRTKSLWAESLRRAAILDQQVSSPHWGTHITFERILQTARKSPELASAALEASGTRQDLHQLWAESLPKNILDATMPVVLNSSEFPGNKRLMYDIWLKRGTKQTIEQFNQKNQSYLKH